ncbi:hypothetical protein [Arthrobacter castelli]|uniref:hypothetical protein n=1 Tax=Arthrobacter castelli TaxID=271431 RepID=UPI00041468FB|nr:hypothetical protein [Arthrobacter castelli]
MPRELDEHLELDLTQLDSAETGRELNKMDMLHLALLGLVLPAALLVWGWM